jgi:hypothetical protein
MDSLRQTLVGLVLVLATSPAAAQQSSRGGEWRCLRSPGLETSLRSYYGDRPEYRHTILDGGQGDPILAALGSRLRPEMNPDLVPGAGGRKFRACNKATGAMLWETELPAGTTGAPLSYMFEGKQYIVVAVGSKEAGSAQFVALSLP